MDEIDYREVDAVAVITINRPARMNALGPVAMRRLKLALLQFEQTAQARVAIVTGAGDRAFCAGADIHETHAAPTAFARALFEHDGQGDSPLYIRDLALPRLGLTKPVIAAVNGVAVGGGMELALNCDIAIASTRGRFGLTEPRVGSIPAVGGIQRLMRSIPRPLAMKFLLTGQIIDAATALQWGLITDLVEPDDLMPRALAIAREIAANAPLSVKAIRYLAEKASALSLQEALDVEELVWGHVAQSRDRLEGRQAFSEKRAPIYTGY